MTGAVLRFQRAVGAGTLAAIVVTGCGGPATRPSPTSAPTAAGTGSGTPPAQSPGSSATPARPGAAAPVPGLLAASVTFISPQDGWVLGTVPCGASACLAIARTQDAGASWTRVTAPPTTFSGHTGSSGVRGIRFADSRDGWAFGPDLWATHDGGATWTRITTAGCATGAPCWSSPDVEGLEASASAVDAVVLAPAQSAVRVATSRVGTNGWYVWPTTIPLGGGPVPHPQLVLQGSSGWVIEVDRTVIGGARLGSAGWGPWSPPCTQVNGPASLAASSPQDLVAVCDQGVWGPATPAGVRVWVSHSGGASFTMLATPLPVSPGGGAGPVASPSSTVAAVGVGSTILATFNGGSTWGSVYSGGGSIAYLGFTTATQGVAVETRPSTAAGSLLMTRDGGHHWVPVPI
jgi:hypothetical protein